MRNHIFILAVVVVSFIAACCSGLKVANIDIGPPVAPSNLTLTVVSTTQINVRWRDNSSNETQFLIERSLNGISFAQIAAVSANVTNYSSTGLQPNTKYYFRARATNSAGNSAYSNALKVRNR
jgi:titin